MALIAHLEELRKRLMIVLGIFLVLFSTAFVYVEPIYQWLVRDLDLKLAVLGPAVVILFLTAIGLLNPRTLKKYRKIAYFFIAVTSVLITPPDLISDILVLVPLVLIYEVSISLSAFVYRKKIEKACLESENAF